MSKLSYVSLTSEGFSFHTLELHYCPKAHEFTEIKKYIKWKSKDCGKEYYRLDKYESDCVYSALLQDQGIRIYMTKADKNNIVKLVINPRRLLDENAGYIGIFHISSKSFEEFYDKFTEAMRVAKLPEAFDDWKLTRLDLCVNLQSDRKKLPMALIYLLSRAATPAGYEKNHFIEDLRAGGNGKRDGWAHRLELSNDSVSFVAYDKIFQAKKENLIVESKYQDKGILRIELQLYKRWLDKYAKKEGIHSTSALLEILADNSKALICKYAGRLFPGGVHYHMGELKDNIKDALKIKDKTRKKMLELVKALDDTISFDKAWDRVSESWTKKQRKNVLAAFKKLGINPIPLHYKKLERLPSVVEILSSLDEEEDEAWL